MELYDVAAAVALFVCVSPFLAAQVVPGPVGTGDPAWQLLLDAATLLGEAGGQMAGAAAPGSLEAQDAAQARAASADWLSLLKDPNKLGSVCIGKETQRPIAMVSWEIEGAEDLPGNPNGVRLVKYGSANVGVKREKVSFKPQYIRLLLDPNAVRDEGWTLHRLAATLFHEHQRLVREACTAIQTGNPNPTPPNPTPGAEYPGKKWKKLVCEDIKLQHRDIRFMEWLRANPVPNRPLSATGKKRLQMSINFKKNKEIKRLKGEKDQLPN